MPPTAGEKHFEVRLARNAEFFRSDRPWAAIQISHRDEFRRLVRREPDGTIAACARDTEDADVPESFNPALATEILDFSEAMWDKVEVFWCIAE